MFYNRKELRAVKQCAMLDQYNSITRKINVYNMTIFTVISVIVPEISCYVKLVILKLLRLAFYCRILFPSIFGIQPRIGSYRLSTHRH